MISSSFTSGGLQRILWFWQQWNPTVATWRVLLPRQDLNVGRFECNVCSFGECHVFLDDIQIWDYFFKLWRKNKGKFIARLQRDVMFEEFYFCILWEVVLLMSKNGYVALRRSPSKSTRTSQISLPTFHGRVQMTFQNESHHNCGAPKFPEIHFTSISNHIFPMFAGVICMTFTYKCQQWDGQDSSNLWPWWSFMVPAWGGGDSPNPQNGQCYYVQHGNHLEPALKILGCTCGHEMMMSHQTSSCWLKGWKGWEFTQR